MKLYHVSAQDDHDAAMGAIEAIPGVQAAGGTVSPAFTFGSDPDVHAVIVVILPEGVDPSPFFEEGREITFVTDLTIKEIAGDNEAEDQRDSGGEDGRQEGAGEGLASEEAAS